MTLATSRPNRSGRFGGGTVVHAKPLIRTEVQYEPTTGLFLLSGMTEDGKWYRFCSMEGDDLRKFARDMVDMYEDFTK